MDGIIFQNENFIVCDKLPQVLSVPAREKDDSRPCLGLSLQRYLKTQVFPVHRLDYEVSGLILFAINSQSHKESQKWFLNRKINKKYEAVTKNQDFTHWPEKIATHRETFIIQKKDTYTWKTQILRGKKRSYESAHGEWSETLATVDSLTDSQILWNLQPLTGKPHQLRLELSRRGFPILGDHLYGSKENWKFPGIGLRAVELDMSDVADRLGLPEIITLKRWIL